MNLLDSAERIFFVGVGGIGLSGLARLLRAQGKICSGSDVNESSTTTELEKEGMHITIGHQRLPEDTDLVIYSEAVPLDVPELNDAEQWGIPMMTYFEALGELTENYRLIALAGTHGKTTTTAMLGLILINAGLDPTVLVGSKLREFDGKNVRMGASDLFIVEACEYRRNFLPLNPELTGVLNIELDHVDYFNDFEDYESAFKQLAEQSGEVIWPDEVSEYEGKMFLPGYHNRMNAGMAAVLARRLGVNEDVIAETLAGFTGTWRRFDYQGTANGALVYDDYAHHPTEIKATLLAAREKHPEARIVAVFEPHQYSRTAEMLDGFAASFEEADEVIIPGIYGVRDSEEAKNLVSAESLVAAIGEHHEKVSFGDGYEETAKKLLANSGPGELIMIMGAGTVNKIIPMILDDGGGLGAS